MPISLPLPPTPALSLRGGGWSVFHLTAVLRLQVCSGSIGPSRSACPFPLTPTSPSGRGGWFCVSADSCVAFTGVFGIDRATPISLASSPLTPTLSLRERGWFCVSADGCVAFTGVFGIDRATPISLAFSPSPQPSPSGRGGWFVFRLTAVLRLQVCSGGSGHADQLAPSPTPALSPGGRGSYSVYAGSHALADGIACMPIWKPAPTSPLAPLGRGLG